MAGEVEGEPAALADPADPSRISWYQRQGLEPMPVQQTQPLSEVHPDAHAVVIPPQ
jgi:hypothetical protein